MNISAFVLTLTVGFAFVLIAYLAVYLEKYGVPIWVILMALIFISACIAGVITE